MPKFSGAVAELERDDDFEVTVESCAVIGLDEAGGCGDTVGVTGDAGSARPGSEVVARVIPEPVPEFGALDDDSLEVTVQFEAVIGLDETDADSGHLRRAFQAHRDERRSRQLEVA